MAYILINLVDVIFFCFVACQSSRKRYQSEIRVKDAFYEIRCQIPIIQRFG